MIIDGIKFTCEKCLKGHRSANCPDTHADRLLIEVKQKGRPKSQCPKCQKHRMETNTHSRCQCPGAPPPLVLPNGAAEILTDPSHSPLRRPGVASTSVSASCSSASSTENLNATGDPSTLGRRKSVTGSRRKDSSMANKPHNLAHGHEASTSHVPHTFSPYPHIVTAGSHGHPRSLSRASSSASSSRRPSLLVKPESASPRTPDLFPSLSSTSSIHGRESPFILPPPRTTSSGNHSPNDPPESKSESNSASLPTPIQSHFARSDLEVSDQTEVGQILAGIDPELWQQIEQDQKRQLSPIDASASTFSPVDPSWKLPQTVDELQTWQPLPTPPTASSSASSEHGDPPSSKQSYQDRVVKSEYLSSSSVSAWPASSASSSIGDPSSAQFTNQQRPVWPALEQVPMYDTEDQIDRWLQVTNLETREEVDQAAEPQVRFSGDQFAPSSSLVNAIDWTLPPNSRVPEPIISMSTGHELREDDYEEDRSIYASLRMEDRCETITPLIYEPAADTEIFNFSSTTTTTNSDEINSSRPTNQFHPYLPRGSTEDFFSSSHSTLSSSADSSKAASSIDPNEEHYYTEDRSFESESEEPTRLSMALEEFALGGNPDGFDQGFAERAKKVAEEIAARQKEMEDEELEGEFDDDDDDDDEDEDDDEEEGFDDDGGYEEDDEGEYDEDDEEYGDGDNRPPLKVTGPGVRFELPPDPTFSVPATTTQEPNQEEEETWDLPNHHQQHHGRADINTPH